MPKKTRIRSTKQKKSALQRQKQSQDVKQSVRVVVNLQDKRKRRRPARKAANAAPFRGEPIGGISRGFSTPAVIVSGNISDDQRKAIMADGARQLALERQAQELNSAREEAIENDRDRPFLPYGGTKSESNYSVAASQRPQSEKESIWTVPVGFDAAPEVKEKMRRGRKPDTSEVRLARRFKTFKEKGITKSTFIDLTDDERAELNDMIAQYKLRNPIKTLQKTGSKKISDLGMVAEASSGSDSGFNTPGRTYDANADNTETSRNSTPARKEPPFNPLAGMPGAPAVYQPFINPFAK